MPEDQKSSFSEAVETGASAAHTIRGAIKTGKAISSAAKGYIYLNNDGVPAGIDVEIATEAFRRMGYAARFEPIDWEQKTDLVESGTIDCIWGCFSMDGREEDNWFFFKRVPSGFSDIFIPFDIVLDINILMALQRIC